MDINIVNINNIEELILTKHEIELKLIKNGVIEEKMELKDFISNYVITDYVYLINDIIIPFKLMSIDDKKYLFISTNNKTELDLLLNKLKLMKYDINNKIEVSYNDLLLNSHKLDSVIIHDKKYYK